MVTNAVFAQGLNYPTSKAFTPLYCEGDDLRWVRPKPIVLYKEVPGSRIEIPNMPPVKEQGWAPACRAFSLAALLQKYTCEKWKNDIPDCSHPPPDSEISYFGMMAYTSVRISGQGSSQVFGKFLDLDNSSKNWGSAYDLLESFRSHNKLFLEGCKKYDVLFTKPKEELFDRLKDIYKSRNFKGDGALSGPRLELDRVLSTSANSKIITTALKKETYEEFLYSVLFEGCREESFPVGGWSTRAYPEDGVDVGPADIKAMILKALQRGKVAWIPSVCLSAGTDGLCDENQSHAVLVSGYRRAQRGASFIDLFKIHNSWGLQWQRENNDGWVDAELFVSSMGRRIKSDGTSRIGSASVIWLE